MLVYYIILMYLLFITGRCFWILGLNHYLYKKSIWDLYNDPDYHSWYIDYFNAITWLFNPNTYVYWNYNTIYKLLKEWNKND